MDQFHWTNLLNPEFYITLTVGGVQLGLAIVIFIVFAETGLFAGFFLPGDSLLFLSGIYASGTYENGIYHPGLIDQIYHINNDFLNVTVLAALVTVAGVFGNMMGYWFGSKSGYYLYNREDSFWFKKKYLVQSHDFFEKHGGRAIIFSRFLPIFRTFAPIVAGIAEMDRKKFMFYNIISSVAWSFSLIFAGHYMYGFLLSKFNLDMKEHIEVIIIGLIALTMVPVALKFFKKAKPKSQP
jgi:membrane-associated protein